MGVLYVGMGCLLERVPGTGRLLGDASTATTEMTGFIMYLPFPASRIGRSPYLLQACFAQDVGQAIF